MPKNVRAHIGIYNSLGVEITKLYEGVLTEGEHTFLWNAVNIASGAYFCRIEADDITETKMIIKE
jgi:hypothetical protein